MVLLQSSADRDVPVSRSRLARGAQAVIFAVCQRAPSLSPSTDDRRLDTPMMDSSPRIVAGRYLSQRSNCESNSGALDIAHKSTSVPRGAGTGRDPGENRDAPF